MRHAIAANTAAIDQCAFQARYAARNPETATPNQGGDRRGSGVPSIDPMLRARRMLAREFDYLARGHSLAKQRGKRSLIDFRWATDLRVPHELARPLEQPFRVFQR